MMIQQASSIRKIDAMGRVVLPIEIREMLGIEKNDKVEIFLDEENGQIIIRAPNKKNKNEPYTA